MPVFFYFSALFLMNSAFCADSGYGHIKKLFQSDYYTVAFETPATFDPNAELEIGDGSGHGFNLRWIRFRPGQEGVEVLLITLQEARQPYLSKWPPDLAPVAVKRARMKGDAYAALLRDLAIVKTLKLQSKPRFEGYMTSSNFWVSVRLTAKKKLLMSLMFAGYKNSNDEMDFAKPRAAVSLAREAIEGLDFKEYSLTDGDRNWASAKFYRDWETFKDRDFFWWVQERYIILTGVVADEKAVSTLCEILRGDPQNRSVYYAINALARLTKKDLRDKPVEEMDVEKTRQKYLRLLKGEK